MRKLLLLPHDLTLALVTALVLATGLMTATAATACADEYQAKIGGGPIGGTFNTFANTMAVYIPKYLVNIKFFAVRSGGSVENVKRVSSGESQFGLCYAVDSALGADGKLPEDTNRYDGTRVLGFLYGASAQLVVRANSGIRSVRDLEGKCVAVGSAGSGAATSAERFFRHLKIWEHLTPRFLGYSAAANAFKNGKIDAFWILTGYPNRAVIEAGTQEDIRLIDVGVEAERSGFYKAYAYTPVTIPANTYGQGQPPCHTFQDATFLCANQNVPAHVVHNVMTILWSPAGQETMAAAKTTFRSMNLKNGFAGTGIPLHPGAVWFWREHGKTIPDRLDGHHGTGRHGAGGH